MHFPIFRQSITILSTFFLLAAAAPMTPNPAKVLTKITVRGSINDCGDSTFINGSSAASPLISDCLQIAANIAGGGTWTTSGLSDFRTLVSYGTCALGVQQVLGLDEFHVGNQDIIDLINSAIGRFAWEGKVGASGVMECQLVGVGTFPTDWAIYHT